MSWNQDLYALAMDWAADHHQGQTIPGSKHPYETHLAKVAMEVMAALPHHPGADGNLAVICAVLHDTIEDTSATYEAVRQRFGIAVADGVLALTKNEQVPKESRMSDSLDRILRQPSEIAMVKLADRITNLEPPPYYWTREKALAYQAEARIILERLGHTSAFLAARLQHRIDHYAIPNTLQQP